ncbi:hypothetical protein DXB96_01215 [Clostridium sp. OM07-10AC]|nr:hypothetical protein DXB96_01215 [Clostridium sp. OM07-10AC]
MQARKNRIISAMSGQFQSELPILKQTEIQIGIDRGNEMFEELGISFGTALIVLLALYFIIKWAVKNGIKEAYRDITGKVTTEDIEAEQICNM